MSDVKLTALQEFTILRRVRPHRFSEIACSQCGRGQGSGNYGFSHCKDHRREQINAASATKHIEAALAAYDDIPTKSPTIGVYDGGDNVV